MLAASLPIHNEDQLLNDIVWRLLHPEVPVNCNLVVPPGFEPDRIASKLAERLGQSAPAAPLALLTVDGVRGPIEYLEILHQQWAEKEPSLKAPIHSNHNRALQELLLPFSRERPAIQILSRFHKILDTMDSWVLAALRTAEQEGRLRTIAICPVDYKTLKQRWEERGHVFVVSDYGNEGHDCIVVEPAPLDDILSWAKAQGIRMDVARYATTLTGGYPEPFCNLVNWWRRNSERTLDRALRGEMKQVAIHALDRFVRWLDCGSNTVFREATIRLMEGNERASRVLARHPWKGLLLNKDGELLAEAVGPAAVEAMLQDALTKSGRVDAVDVRQERAHDFYWNRQYAAARRILETEAAGGASLAQRVLLAHSKIMEIIGNCDPGIDTDWRKLATAVEEALVLVRQHAKKLEEPELLIERHEALLQIARTIAGLERGQTRLVDALASAALGSGGRPAAQAALLLLELQVRNAECKVGDSEAFMLMLPLPEQIVRVWALWGLGLDFNEVPTQADAVWDEVATGLQFKDGVRAPVPGERFENNYQFAHFALAYARMKTVPSVPLLEESTAKLDASLKALNQRNDGAHALSRFNRNQRQNFFEMTRRWLTVLESSSRVRFGDISLAMLGSHVQPLPLIDARGAIEVLDQD